MIWRDRQTVDNFWRCCGDLVILRAIHYKVNVRMKPFFKTIFPFFRTLARPVGEQPVFFILAFLMFVQQPIQWMCYLLDDRLGQTLRFIQGLCIEFAVVWIATWLIYVAKSGSTKIVVKAVLYTVFFLLMGISYFLVLNFEMCISQQTLTVLVETNPKESSEFLDTYLWTNASQLSYMIDVVVLVLIVVGEWKRKAIARFIRQKWNMRFFTWFNGVLAAIGLLWLPVCHGWLLCCNNSSKIYTWRHYFPYDSLDPWTQSLHAINSLRAFNNDVDFAIEAAKKVYTTEATVEESDSLTVIYVLGESYNKHHASLYGYPRLTTPCMEREQKNGNLFAFTDVVAQENVTSVVEKNTFSINSVSDGENWFDHPNFTTIFKRSGYDVWMWDMQRTYMSHRLYTITVNAYIYNPEIERLSYTGCNDTTFTYDMQLIDDFQKKAKITKKHNLVVFHLMGQHVSFSKRYPRKSIYEKYHSSDIHRTEKWMDKTKKWCIATYDNATLYNDAVMGHIFNLYRNKNAVVVYFSDHGEEIYDYRDDRGRHVSYTPSADMLRHQNEVPFIIWCSDRYKQLHPATISQMKAALNRPFMTDNVGQILLHLGGIRTPYYRPERDLISPSFKKRPRILYDHVDYDQVMAKK